jgi:hypothetical protein
MILELNTERLLLRKYKHGDFADYHKLKADPPRLAIFNRQTGPRSKTLGARSR